MIKNKKAQGGLGGTVAAILGAGGLIWLLITLGGTGALFGILSNKLFVGLAIFIFIIWLLRK